MVFSRKNEPDGREDLHLYDKGFVMKWHPAYEKRNGMDIKEIRERRERLQHEIAAAIEEFEKLTTLDVREIKLTKGIIVGAIGFSEPTTVYRVELDTPI